MDWKDAFKKDQEIVLSTCSRDGKPNANIVISLGFSRAKLMIANVSMETTIRNLKENPRICVIGGYFKILGKVKIFTSGDNFNKSVKVVASQDKTLKVRSAIVVDIEEVYDLDKVKKIL